MQCQGFRVSGFRLSGFRDLEFRISGLGVEGVVRREERSNVVVPT